MSVACVSTYSNVWCRLPWFSANSGPKKLWIWLFKEHIPGFGSPKLSKAMAFCGSSAFRHLFLKSWTKSQHRQRARSRAFPRTRRSSLCNAMPSMTCLCQALEMPRPQAVFEPMAAMDSYGEICVYIYISTTCNWNCASKQFVQMSLIFRGLFFSPRSMCELWTVKVGVLMSIFMGEKMEHRLSRDRRTIGEGSHDSPPARWGSLDWIKVCLTLPLTLSSCRAISQAPGAVEDAWTRTPSRMPDRMSE